MQSTSDWRAASQPGGAASRWVAVPAPEAPVPEQDQFPAFGYLALNRKGWGHLRAGAIPRPDDPFLPPDLVGRFGLRPGDYVDALAVAGRKGPIVEVVWRVNGHGPENLAGRPDFKRLVAIHPEEPIRLGYKPDAIPGRLLDLVAPVGRGQRALIVAPPQAGKTTMLENIAKAAAVDPDLNLLVCLVGERPEEATALRRSIQGEVLVADLDAPERAQIAVVDTAMAHARRLTEEGQHVVVLMDSLTRLARVHNLAARGGSRTLSGGIDASALTPVRQVFGSARTTEDAGSLTLIATCLIDTNSRLDQVVYEEFKGTGNMEVHLDRKLAQLGLFPAVNIARSSTRREALLLDETTLEQMTLVRRALTRMNDAEGLSVMLDVLRAYPDNHQALDALLA
ncbi:MAG: transcription termination factor Rho [Chloroflexota bacterium]|nr:transcription termination factor Rho [Chloroflexota bacterium]